MSTELTVEGIVAQIRKRIREENTQGAKSQHPNGIPIALPTSPGYRERVAEDFRCFRELDMQIEGAVARIGGKPPVPPTWRGRFGSWAIDLLRRLMWWYATPIQETFELLNRRNSEQASRHQQMQEQIVALMDGLQHVLKRTEDIETLRQEVADWRSESLAPRREIERQLRSEARSREALAQKTNGHMEWVEQNLRGQIDELKGNLQDLHVSIATVDSRRVELAQRAAETVRAAWGRLPVLEMQLQIEAEARQALAAEMSRHAGDLEQNLMSQIDELKGSLLELRVSTAASGGFRTELTQRISEVAQRAENEWRRLPAVEAQLQVEAEARQAVVTEFETRLRREAEARQAVVTEFETRLRREAEEREVSAKKTSGHVEWIEQNLRVQIDELRANVAQEVEEERGRLPALETKLQAEAEAREALATGINSHVEQLERNLRGHIAELQGGVHELRAASPSSDSIRAELAQRISEASRMAWGRLPVLETRLQLEAEAREALAAEINGHVERLEQLLTGQVDELKGSLQEVQASNAAADALHTQLAQRVSEANQTAWGRLPVLETRVNVEAEAREALATEISNNVERLEQKIGDGMAGLAGRASQLALVVDKQRSELRVQEHRLSMFLRELRSRLPQTLTEPQVRQITEDLENKISTLYADFEDVFRGPRDEIKERLNVYIPRLRQAKVGSREAPVLDMGCGRGEWLQLLAEHDLTGRGVDANSIMISRCGELGLGLEVIKADALEYLRSLPDKSLGAITSFHMIEHLPFEMVIEIVDEALRVLRSGGLLILETPNPGNALVGSQTFWIDPTHIRPIPSQTLQFFVEARGFCQVEVLNLQPYQETVRVPENDGGVAQRFNDYFYGPQDYSVIGQRP